MKKDTNTVTTPAGYRRNFAPVREEVDLPCLSVTGNLPADLNGTLVRNGPNPLNATTGAHWFDGDGMVHAFRFDGGRVAYRNRWVRTPRWLAAKGEGHISVDEGASSVGNTNIVFHAGHLLALEEAHLPLRLNSISDTRALPFDFAGGVTGPFTAHPKTDPISGELLFFGYGTPVQLGDGMAFGTISPQGTVTRFDRFKAPYPSMVHDFGVTSGHALFPITPLVADATRAIEGGPPFAWQPELGAFVGIVRRDRSLDTIDWRQAPAGHVFHVMNAWEDARRIHLDVMQADAPALFNYADGTCIEGDTNAYLSRWTFDLDPRSRDFAQEWLCDIPGEFPRIDDRYSGFLHQHGWFIGDGVAGQPFTRIVHIDHANGRLDVHELADGDCASEAVFVPRAPLAEEGEGWLLSVVYRGRSDLSDLLIFDAQHVCAGPIAAAHLPCRVPNGFHGTWLSSNASVTATFPA